MQGHEYVWDLRQIHKKKPTCIFINDFPCREFVTDPEDQGVMPNVVTHGDVIESLDLRFVVGCMVSANSPSERRAKALFERLKAFNPSLMVVAHHRTKKTFPGFEPDLWIGTWKAGEENV